MSDQKRPESDQKDSETTQKLPRNYPETSSEYNARTKRNYRFPA